MITVISGTNRTDSETMKFAQHIESLLKDKSDEAIHLFSMMDLPSDFLTNQMYDKGGQAESLGEIQNEVMIPANKFVFVMPEYNGGFPGIVKLFIDACSARAYKETFKGKKAALVGVATGRAGNLRGIDHMTSILNHMGTLVMPKQLPISSIGDLKNGNGKIEDEGTIKAMEAYVDAFLAF